MHQICVHLYSPDIASQYISALRGDSVPAWSWWQADLPTLLQTSVSESDANRFSSGLVLSMAEAMPTFYYDQFSLTAWEAQVDHGIGMLLRPPARVFVDHGINPHAIGSMSIRLAEENGSMAGAWIPPHLIPKLYELIDARLERWAKRIHQAELDPYPLLTTLHMATQTAMQNNLGLIESIDVLPPNARVVETPNRKKMDQDFRHRIDIALEEEKQGILGKLFRRDS